MYQTKTGEVITKFPHHRGVGRQAFEDSDEAMAQAAAEGKKNPEMKYWVEEIIIYPPLETK